MADYEDDIICEVPFDGKKYPLHPRDITVSRLRQWGQKYGRDYGAYATFTALFFQGDADAVACVLSLLLEKDGIKRPPEYIEFSPYDIYKAINEANAEKEQRLRDKAQAEADDANPQVEPPADEMIRDGEPT